MVVPLTRRAIIENAPETRFCITIDAVETLTTLLARATAIAAIARWAFRLLVLIASEATPPTVASVQAVPSITTVVTRSAVAAHCIPAASAMPAKAAITEYIARRRPAIATGVASATIAVVHAAISSMTAASAVSAERDARQASVAAKPATAPVADDRFIHSLDPRRPDVHAMPAIPAIPAVPAAGVDHRQSRIASSDAPIASRSAAGFAISAIATASTMAGAELNVRHAIRSVPATAADASIGTAVPASAAIADQKAGRVTNDSGAITASTAVAIKVPLPTRAAVGCIFVIDVAPRVAVLTIRTVLSPRISITLSADTGRT